MAEYIEREYLLYEFREIMPEMGVDELADEICMDSGLNIRVLIILSVVIVNIRFRIEKRF